MSLAFVGHQLAFQITELSAVRELDVAAPQDMGLRQESRQSSGGRVRCDIPHTTLSLGQILLQRVKDGHFTTFSVDLEDVDLGRCRARREIGMRPPAGPARSRRACGRWDKRTIPRCRSCHETRAAFFRWSTGQKGTPLCRAVSPHCAATAKMDTIRLKGIYASSRIRDREINRSSADVSPNVNDCPDARHEWNIRISGPGENVVRYLKTCVGLE